jgi:hypothetical protein
VSGEARAQGPAGVEAGIQGLILSQRPVWWGGALVGGYRPGGKARLSVTLGAGRTDSRWSARGELLAHLLLSPARRSGAGVYGFGGIAGTAGPRDQGYLVLGLGVERAPALGSGWMLEAGVGGGLRLAAGWRWRRFRAP